MLIILSISIININIILSDISSNNIEIIVYSIKLLLFDGNELWIKKDANVDFEITLGSHDLAERECEMVRVFTLNKLSKKINAKKLVVMPCAIHYYLHNLKNVKNTKGRVLLLVKLQAKTCNFTKSDTPPWVLSTFFLDCTNGTKL